MQSPAARDAVVTGLGAVCALADGCDGLWAALVERRCGIGPIRRFPTDGFSVRQGALVERWAGPEESEGNLTGVLCRRFAERALREALRAAGLPPGSFDGERVALVFGTGIADVGARIHEIAEEVAEGCGLWGPRLTVSTACSSSTAAIALGRDLLAMDVADVVIAGGSDVLTPEVFAGFHALGVLSPDKCAPFSTPAGTTLGEGAGFLVLERQARAIERGAEIVAALAGCGLSSDAWHETSPEPKGAGVERAILAALHDARLDANDVDYVNVHGSGTEANDVSEWLGLQRALGERARAIPVSSTKGALGHAQGAAGVLETTAMLVARVHETIPPTLNFTTPRALSPSDPVPGPELRSSRWRNALKLNSAFGGSNATLLLSRGRSAPQSTIRRPVYVFGIGEAEPPASQIAIEELIPDADPRGLDVMSRFLTAAAAAALRDAGINIRGPLRERAGLLVGQLRGSPTSIDAFRRSIDERGLLQVSPSAFARIVLNAAAGACSKLLALRGPLSAITTGAGSGLAAIVLAAEILSTRDDADLMVAGGCDELLADEHEVAAGRGEGAACLVLGTARVDAYALGRRKVRMAGWSVGGPSRVADAVTRATLSCPRVTYMVRAEDVAGGKAAAGAVALANGVRAIRDGITDHALVTSSAGRSMTAAILLTGTGIPQ